MCEEERKIYSKDGTVDVPIDCAWGEMCGFDKKDGRTFVRCERIDADIFVGPKASTSTFCKGGLKDKCPLANAPANTPFEIVTKKK